MTEKFICPVCEKHSFDNNNTDESCPECGWWNDIVQNIDADFTGGANEISLNEYRKDWFNGKHNED